MAAQSRDGELVVMRRSLVIALVSIAFLSGFASGCWAEGWLDIDDCLDRGGAWDYERNTCRYE
ncbi:hypothetical protein ABIE62_000711 [Porphyrobacter sp. MBR-155]|uniref:hypothetical protein n=1 Tax=Porphyrobacter sp. MBR-155 TaxID=3156464 RepID=UPI00339A9780